MPTLTGLADIIQIHLSDTAASTWPQTTIEQWIKDAINEYSVHFPRTVMTTIDCVTDQNEYDLPAGFQEAVSVEYPSGEDPPDYLTRLSHQQSKFWQNIGFYDIVFMGDATDLAQIWISEDPTEGESIIIWYQADHKSNLETTDTITVPDIHHHLIIMYVVWLAWRERLAVQEKDPDTTTLMLSQYASNTSRTWRDYTEALNRAKTAQAPGSLTTRWRIDLNDPIY